MRKLYKIKSQRESLFFIIYNFCIWTLTPFICIYLLIRLFKGKEDRKRFKERLGISTFFKISGEIVWIHVASVGEAVSSFKLIKNLLNQDKINNIILTSGTATSAELIKKHFINNDKVIHQYVPIDHEIAIRKFLGYWQPKLLILFESELWPNLIRFSKEKCPIILLNSRLSEKSFQRWKFFKFFLISIFRKIECIYPQSVIDFRKYQNLGANNLKFLGNIKFATEIANDNKVEEEILSVLKGKVVLFAASTHEGEEKGMIEIYNLLKKIYHNLILVIAPRHPSRIQDIVEYLKANKLQYTLRSSKLFNIKEVFLIDTIGELIKFYNIAHIIFVGGSMVKIGGHNPLEAAKLGKFTYMGPYNKNFTEIVEKLIDLQALKIVQNWEELQSEIKKRFEKNMLFDDNQEISRILNDEGEKIIDNYTIEIKKYL